MMLCDVICGLGPMYGLLWNKNMKKPKIVKSLKRSDLGKSLLGFLTATYKRPLCIEQTHRISQDLDVSFLPLPQKILSLSGRPQTRGKRPKKPPFHHLPPVKIKIFPYIYIVSVTFVSVTLCPLLLCPFLLLSVTCVSVTTRTRADEGGRRCY